MLHQDKKRWKQVKHHWFDIIQPIRPHLRWKFFTIGSKYVTILFSMWQEKLKIFMEWTVFSFIAILFLILLYMFAIKKLMTNTLKWQIILILKFWNDQTEIFTSPYQRLKSNFRVSHLIPIFLGLRMCYTKIRKDVTILFSMWNKLSIIDLTS